MGALAAQIGRPGSARAVAGAIAKNLIAYTIPCHRVIRDNGMVTGYRWEPVRKMAMLGMEAAKRGDTGLEYDAHTP